MKDPFHIIPTLILDNRSSKNPRPENGQGIVCLIDRHPAVYPLQGALTVHCGGKEGQLFCVCVGGGGHPV